MHIQRPYFYAYQVLSLMYNDAPGRNTLDPWLLSSLVLGELHDTYGVVTQRTRQEQMCGKLEKGVHRWWVQARVPFCKAMEDKGHQEVDQGVWWGG